MKPQTDTSSPTPAPAKPSLKERMKALMEDYGPVAITVYFSIFGLCIAGFAIAFRLGFQKEGVDTSAGTLGATFFAAWVATKALQPLRILATLALTPPLGRLWLRRKQPRA